MLGDGDKGGRDGMEGVDTLGAGESCSLIDTSAARPEEFPIGDVVAAHAASSFVGNGGFIEGKPSKNGAVVLL